jgi:hypothetical protein
MTDSARRLGWVIGLLVLGIAPASLHAQISGVRPLDFQTLVAGVPKHVARTDPVWSGEFRFTTGSLITQVTLDVPSRLNGPGGASIPLSFSSSDAGYSPTGNINNQTQTFSPNGETITLWLTGRRTASIFVGGTATPSAVQAPGNYSAPITLEVFIF